MRLTRLLTFRSIRSRSLRFLLSAFGIILGVAGLLAIRATNQAALESISTLFQNTSGLAKLTVTSSSVDEEGFSEEITHFNSETGQDQSYRSNGSDTDRSGRQGTISGT